MLARAIRSMKRFFKKKPDETEDPYAYVGAPKKPKPPARSAAAAAELDSCGPLAASWWGRRSLFVACLLPLQKRRRRVEKCQDSVVGRVANLRPIANRPPPPNFS
jgi:hypothetical protein